MSSVKAPVDCAHMPATDLTEFGTLKFWGISYAAYDKYFYSFLNFIDVSSINESDFDLGRLDQNANENTDTSDSNPTDEKVN